MTAFATSDELGDFLGSPIPAGRISGADLLLDLVADEVRDYCHQLFDQVDNDVWTTRGNNSNVLLLPELPVLELTSITLDGDTLEADNDFTLLDHGVLYRGVVPPSVFPSGSWSFPGTGVLASFSQFSSAWSTTSTIVVTYSHGYETIPGALRLAYLQAVARLYTNPTGAVSEQMGQYQVTHERPREPVPAVSMFTLDEQGVLDRYRIDR